VAVSLLPVLRDPFDGRVLLAAGFLSAICVTDTLRSRIPNTAVVTMIVASFVLRCAEQGFAGAVASGQGLVLGLGLLAVPYAMGGMGAGDVKALGALGALLGPLDVFGVFLFSAVVGGGLSLLHYAMGHDMGTKLRQWGLALRAFAVSGSMRCLRPNASEPLRFPYAASFAFGFLAYSHWWHALTRLPPGP